MEVNYCCILFYSIGPSCIKVKGILGVLTIFYFSQNTQFHYVDGLGFVVVLNLTKMSDSSAPLLKQHVFKFNKK